MSDVALAVLFAIAAWLHGCGSGMSFDRWLARRVRRCPAGAPCRTGETMP